MRALLCLIAIALLTLPARAQTYTNYPTNQCYLTQYDAFGSPQCLGYIDPDNSFVMTPADDPKLIPFSKAPWDFQRSKVEDGFTAPTLSQVWTQQTFGTGSISIVAPGKVCIRTGTGPAGSGGVIQLAVVATQLGWDGRAFFFIEVPQAGYFDLQFGFRNPATYERAMFRRYEYGTPQPWQAFTQNAAGQPIGTYAAYGGDNLRRIGIIQLKPGEVDYYVANQLNRFDQAAPTVAHKTSLPSSTSWLSPFVSFTSATAGSDRTTCLSKFAFSGSE